MTNSKREVAVTLPNEPQVDLKTACAHGLSAAEYEAIVRWLGRTPTYTEIGVFSVMWSEHCSYKSSRRHLRKLPSRSKFVVQGPGENAGAIDVGDGWLAVFKIESHNHPSFVEPYQGAATGVGGIVRDIFTMGARPIASLNSLKFGSFDHPRTRFLTAGVIAGIGGYGNCVGIPTVGGEVRFDSAYNGNILVNAFCLGMARKEDLQSARAEGVRNPVLYVGSATGRDGIHGASLLASAEFDATSERKRPTVQVGDPFTEKLLIEACLEAAKTGAIVAIQDMGAAGLTSSSSEMVGRSEGLGIELDLDRVPLRETGLSPYEMLLSESQERMLIVARVGHERELMAVFSKWDLNAVVVGRVTGDGRWRARYRGEIVADIPVAALTREAPEYDRPMAAPERDKLWQKPPGRIPVAPASALRALLDNPNVGAKRWVYRQYDWMVQGRTVVGPGSDAAVLRIKETRRGLALTVDSNPRLCAIDPYTGAIATVCEAALNVACAGARPLAMTDCLNYGNPERPEIMWQFARGVEGIKDAALALKIPVISGNVSFYNETEGVAIPPTPTIAVVGVLSDVSKRVTQYFKRPGDIIIMLRSGQPSLAGSEYVAMFGATNEKLHSVRLGLEEALIEALVASAERGLVRSFHDVSEGGTAVALAESCFNPGGSLGAEVALECDDASEAEALFGQGPSTVLASMPEENVSAFEALLRDAGLECRVIGKVLSERRLRIGGVIDEDCDELRRLYENALPKKLNGHE